MQFRVHYDNYANLGNPYLAVQMDGDNTIHEYAATKQDDYGFVYAFETDQTAFSFRFKDGAGDTPTWEGESLQRHYSLPQKRGKRPTSQEIWCRGTNAFTYDVEPRRAEADSAADFLRGLSFKPGTYIPESGGLSGLGANVLADGRVLFGFFHPTAARVYVTGDFNNWQHPGLPKPKSGKLIELKLYRCYFDMPNVWLAVVDGAQAGQEYKFLVVGHTDATGKREYNLNLSQRRADAIQEVAQVTDDDRPIG